MINKTRAIYFAASLGLVACQGAPVVPVSDLSAGKSAHAARVVREGDTLYTIAWEAGLDYREVARWNGIGPPYRLQTGQTIYLSGKSAAQSVARVDTKPVAVEVVPEQQPTASPAAPIEVPAVAKSSTPVAREETGHGWIWPAEGELTAQFNEQAGNNGIDISGLDGSPVRASANGKVVYAGTGLRGYGVLLIIKHDDTYLSAYAHNRAVMVREGEDVKKGQVIAEMGQSGADSVRLHFEIRRDGQPVDPMRFLPQQN